MIYDFFLHEKSVYFVHYLIGHQYHGIRTLQNQLWKWLLRYVLTQPTSGVLHSLSSVFSAEKEKSKVNPAHTLPQEGAHHNTMFLIQFQSRHVKIC